MTATRPGTQPLTQTARDRLRAQARCEQEMADRVLAAESRLAAEQARRDAALAARDRAVAARRDDVADALIDYVESTGVGIERAALILGRPAAGVARLVRERRRARRCGLGSPDRPGPA